MHPTILWTALLVTCESTIQDLSEAPEEHRICAAQMHDAGLLQRTDDDNEHEYTLSAKGIAALILLDRFRDYTLGK